MRLKTIERLLGIVVTSLTAAASFALTDTVNGIEWTYVVVDGNAHIYRYGPSGSAISRTFKGELTVPSKLGGYKVVRIDIYALANIPGMTSVTVPSCVVEIGNGAFQGCTGLTKMTLPFVGSKRGGSGASEAVFGYIFGGTSYSGGTAVRQNYGSAYATYYVPSSLRTVEITDETVVAHGAFHDCRMLTSITLPDTVTRMDNHSFSGCSKMTSVRLPVTANNMGVYQFNSCSNLTKVLIPKGIKTLGSNLFKDCTKLEDVFLPASIGTIGEKAFYNCVKLSTVVFKGNAPTVGTDGFTGVPSSCCAYVRKDSTGWNVDIPGRWNGLLIDYSRYNVSFNADGGEGTMAAQTMYMGEAAELMPCAFTRSDGYVFTGWATNSNGTAVYDDRASVYDLSDELNATVALYAAWELRFVNVETGNGMVAVPVAWLDKTGIDLTAGYQTVAGQPAANGRPVWNAM